MASTGRRGPFAIRVPFSSTVAGHATLTADRSASKPPREARAAPCSNLAVGSRTAPRTAPATEATATTAQLAASHWCFALLEFATATATAAETTEATAPIQGLLGGR